jgi:C-terminal processing protease CtpA/Prc
VLISADNSSASFQLAQVLKEHGLATLVGQTTGGSQKGITAGALFFVRLPYSGIEVDVPLIGTGYDVAATLPDGGIVPDVLVEPSLEELARGTDPELAAVQRLLQQQSSSGPQQPAGGAKLH